MPLRKGKKNIGKNISELMESFDKTGKIGNSKPKSKKKAKDQATAIALNEASKPKSKKKRK